jgi:hypothetical protein
VWPESSSSYEAILSFRMSETASFREQKALIQVNQHAKGAPLVDHFGVKGIYTGEVRQGEPHGRGRMNTTKTLFTMVNGIKADTTAKESSVMDLAIPKFLAGLSMICAMVMEPIHGPMGVYTPANSRRTIDKQGHGIYTWADSARYEQGSFVDGKQCGMGECRFASGATYDGQWLQGNFYGYGKLTKVDGTPMKELFVRVVSSLLRRASNDGDEQRSNKKFWQ